MKRKRTNRTGLLLVAMMVFIICGIVTYQKNELDKVSQRAQAKMAELNNLVTSEEERTEELKEKKAYVQTYKYIEEMAREKLGLVYKDEIIFKSNEK
jgi:cell division protein FtsB